MRQATAKFIKEPLRKESLPKALPNMITLLRIGLACFGNIYLLRHFGAIALPVMIFLLIYLTDFLDGKVARLSGTASRCGAVMDVMADLFCIITFYLVLCFFRIVPLWFLFVMLFKFGEFLMTSRFLAQRSGKSLLVFDFCGRFVAILFYVMPPLAYVAFLHVKPAYLFTIHQFLYIITILAFISSTSRLWSCCKAVCALKQTCR